MKGDSISLTSLLAFYGAVLSSFGFGWSVYRDLQDRPRLKIGMGVRRIVQSPDGKWYQVQPDMPVEGASKSLYLVVNVTNTGRRPVKWMGWGGKWKKREPGGGAFIIQPIALPTMLKDGDSCSEFTDDLKAAGANVKELFIYDSTGKNWYLSRRALKKLKEECHMFLQASRGCKVIRRQKDEQDVVMSFPSDTALNYMLHACEEGGYKVLGNQTVDTPEDKDYKSTTIITVESK